MIGEAQNYTYIFFLGTHPILSRLEVDSVLHSRGLSSPSRAKLALQGGPTVLETTDLYHIVTTETPLDAQLQDILGGSDRFAEQLGRFTKLPTGAELGQLLNPASAKAPAGRPSSSKKMGVGLSGVDVDGQTLRALGESLKDWWLAQGGKMRYVVPQGKATRLNAAQVMVHKLDQSPHAEITLVKLENGDIGVFKTVAVQDVGAYELRDTMRPIRDTHVGLLPPKLAQIMLNVSLAPTPTNSRGRTILDPFCGMGTVLQEGWLMDYKMVGSDTSPRMTRATEKNLAWVDKHFRLPQSLRPHIFVHQADTRWSKSWHDAFDAVVTEPFLGKPLKRPLPKAQLEKQMNDLGDMYRKVFTALRPTLKEGGVIVFILPAFRAQRGGEEWQLFPERFLDALTRVGYSKVQLGNLDRSDMLYARPQALVGRELTVWRKA